MLRFNRAIDKGCCAMIHESEGINTVLAVTQDLRPATVNIIYVMKQTEHKCEFQPIPLADIDTVPICEDLNDFEPIELKLASGTDWNPIWDQLVRKYHLMNCCLLFAVR